MQIKDLTDFLETIAPLSLQESYDNCGLIVGNKQATVTKALITLDCTEEVVDEAIQNKCELIIAHHPIVFGGLKKLNGKNYVERIVIKAIKNDIAIYAIHTNLDNVIGGVNDEIAKRLCLINSEVLVPKRNLLKKLYTFIPVKDVEKVSQAVFNAGGGNIGNYSETGFQVFGKGSFKGNELSNPTIGTSGKTETVEEVKFETIFPAHLENQLIQALLQAHPYEEVAYDIVVLENEFAKVGSGMVGDLKEPMSAESFLHFVKKQLQTECIRHTKLLNMPIERVAVCGGSGRFLLNNAIASGAQVFITADFKYHDFFDADNKILVADVGHYESEQYTKDKLYALLSDKFTTFALLLSKINTNPVKYL